MMQWFLTHIFYSVTPPSLPNTLTPDLILPSPSYTQGLLFLLTHYSPPTHPRLYIPPDRDSKDLPTPSTQNSHSHCKLLSSSPLTSLETVIAVSSLSSWCSQWTTTRMRKGSPSFPLPASFLSELAPSLKSQHHLVLKQLMRSQISSKAYGTWLGAISHMEIPMCSFRKLGQPPTIKRHREMRG